MIGSAPAKTMVKGTRVCCDDGMYRTLSEDPKAVPDTNLVRFVFRGYQQPDVVAASLVEYQIQEPGSWQR
jgi:hypothetical protein